MDLAAGLGTSVVNRTFSINGQQELVALSFRMSECVIYNEEIQQGSQAEAPVRDDKLSQALKVAHDA